MRNKEQGKNSVTDGIYIRVKSTMLSMIVDQVQSYKQHGHKENLSFRSGTMRCGRYVKSAYYKTKKRVKLNSNSTFVKRKLVRNY